MSSTAQHKKSARRLRIKRSIRRRISGTQERPRLSVFRSNTAIYAQVIDDRQGKVLCSVSSLDKSMVDTKAPKVELSRMVGTLLATKAKEAGVSKVVFDRNGFLYHGRVKALADGAREGGLDF